MADALDLDALEATAKAATSGPYTLRQATVLALIARCRAAEQRADNAERDLAKAADYAILIGKRAADAEGQVAAMRAHWGIAAIVQHVAGEHRGPVRIGNIPYHECERLAAALAPRAEATPDAMGDLIRFNAELREQYGDPATPERGEPYSNSLEAKPLTPTDKAVAEHLLNEMHKDAPS